MTDSKALATPEHAFSLRSGERAVLCLDSGRHTCVRLESKSYSKSLDLSAAVPLALPAGAVVHPENILVAIAEDVAQLNDKLATFPGEFRVHAQSMLEKEIGILHIKAEAKGLLTEYVQAASLEQDVMADREKQAWLKQVADDLAARIDRAENFPNKAFRGLAEATARCLVLYRDDPDAYAKLVGGIGKQDTDIFLDSLRGLATLESLVRGLSDDHNFVFNPASGSVEYQSDATGRLHGLVPVTFLEIVVATQAASTADKAGKRTPAP